VRHFGSLSLNDEEFEKLDKVAKEYLQMSRPAFLKAIALQFSKQYHAGEIPDWPPRFVVRPDIEGKKKKAGPAKPNRPLSPKKKKPKRPPPPQA